MAVLLSTVIDRAEKILYDETNVRWAANELVDYANAGIQAIVANKPDAYSLVVNYALTPNSSKQTIPADGLQFLDIVRVVGGGAIRHIERNHLDHTDPDWHTVLGAPKHYMHDPRVPDTFWVYPVPSSSTSVELAYAGTPAIITINQAIPLDDIYQNALCWWIVGMAYAKNTTRGDMNKANAYFTLFANSIGAKTQVQAAFTPLPPDESQGTNK